MTCTQAKTLSYGQYHAIVDDSAVTLRIGSNPKDSQTVLVVPNTHIDQVRLLLTDTVKLKNHLIGIDKIRKCANVSDKVKDLTDDALIVLITEALVDLNAAAEKHGIPKEDLSCVLQVYASQNQA